MFKLNISKKGYEWMKSIEEPEGGVFAMKPKSLETKLKPKKVNKRK